MYIFRYIKISRMVVTYFILNHTPVLHISRHIQFLLKFLHITYTILYLLRFHILVVGSMTENTT